MQPFDFLDFSMSAHWRHHRKNLLVQKCQGRFSQNTFNKWKDIHLWSKVWLCSGGDKKLEAQRNAFQLSGEFIFMTQNSSVQQLTSIFLPINYIPETRIDQVELLQWRDRNRRHICLWRDLHFRPGEEYFWRSHKKITLIFLENNSGNHTHGCDLKRTFNV